METDEFGSRAKIFAIFYGVTFTPLPVSYMFSISSINPSMVIMYLLIDYLFVLGLVIFTSILAPYLSSGQNQLEIFFGLAIISSAGYFWHVLATISYFSEPQFENLIDIQSVNYGYITLAILGLIWIACKSYTLYSASPEEKNSFEQVYVPPWVLPQEIFPIHLFWDKSIIFDNIRISIPTGINIHDTQNVLYSTTTPNSLIITGIDDPGHLLVYMSYHPIPSNQMDIEINVEMIHDSTTILIHTLIAKISPPKLRLHSAPTSIIISDSNTPSIDLKFMLTPLKPVEVIFETDSGQGFFQAFGSIYDRITELLLNNPNFRILEDLGDRYVDFSLARNVVIDEFRRKLQNLEFVRTLNPLDLSNISRIITGTSPNTLRKIICGCLSLIDQQPGTTYFNIQPSSYITLWQGQILLRITNMVQYVRLRYYYFDQKGNRYGTEECTIAVDDRRTNRSLESVIPLEIRYNNRTNNGA